MPAGRTRLGERTLRRCQASVKANASLDSLKPRFAVEAHLAHLFEIETNEVDEEHDQPIPQAEASSQSVEGEEVRVPMQLPTSLSQEEREALSQQNAARHDWIEEVGAQDRSVTGRGSQRIADLQVSTTDPDATIMLHKDGSHLGYQTRLSRRWRQSAHHLDRVSDACRGDGKSTHARFDLARHVTGDTKYGTEENIVALETQHIRAYVPLPDIDHRTEFLSADRFRYEAERDVYLCPAGKALHFFPAHSTERSRRYRARAKDCNHCPRNRQMYHQQPGAQSLPQCG